MQLVTKAVLLTLLQTEGYGHEPVISLFKEGAEVLEVVGVDTPKRLVGIGVDHAPLSHR